jgi:hypothetical protein
MPHQKRYIPIYKEESFSTVLYADLAVRRKLLAIPQADRLVFRIDFALSPTTALSA